ncbi:pinensin family lanthipeptide [Longimicrobium sp.]|uniref:pinensin family lanthipeptide n=1 Tax=Longimicrobium sp. TaxID=2029185 RepID=UPI002E36C8A1|nr:pinensin family lanthipeptide [Longimicrobium sp.]HEX6039478.1 pinensin family lanthipeptide [Longimicrobium sp.]
MHKLRLEDLRIESFETAGTPDARGTVHAHLTNPCIKTVYATCPLTCDDATCVGSCQGTSCYLPACGSCLDSCPGGACPDPSDTTVTA